MYIIGKFKAGEDFAKRLISFKTKQEAQTELIYMWQDTDFAPEDNAPENVSDLLQSNCFSEDTTTYAVFKAKENAPLITKIWGGRNFKSNQL